MLAHFIRVGTDSENKEKRKSVKTCRYYLQPNHLLLHPQCEGITEFPGHNELLSAIHPGFRQHVSGIVRHGKERRPVEVDADTRKSIQQVKRDAV